MVELYKLLNKKENKNIIKELLKISEKIYNESLLTNEVSEKIYNDDVSLLTKEISKKKINCNSSKLEIENYHQNKNKNRFEYLKFYLLVFFYEFYFLIKNNKEKNKWINNEKKYKQRKKESLIIDSFVIKIPYKEGTNNNNNKNINDITKLLSLSENSSKKVNEGANVFLIEINEKSECKNSKKNNKNSNTENDIKKDKSSDYKINVYKPSNSDSSNSDSSNSDSSNSDSSNSDSSNSDSSNSNSSNSNSSNSDSSNSDSSNSDSSNSNSSNSDSSNSDSSNSDSSNSDSSNSDSSNSDSSNSNSSNSDSSNSDSSNSNSSNSDSSNSDSSNSDSSNSDSSNSDSSNSDSSNSDSSNSDSSNSGLKIIKEDKSESVKLEYNLKTNNCYNHYYYLIIITSNDGNGEIFKLQSTYNDKSFTQRKTKCLINNKFIDSLIYLYSVLEINGDNELQQRDNLNQQIKSFPVNFKELLGDDGFIELKDKQKLAFDNFKKLNNKLNNIIKSYNDTVISNIITELGSKFKNIKESEAKSKLQELNKIKSDIEKEEKNKKNNNKRKINENDDHKKSKKPKRNINKRKLDNNDNQIGSKKLKTNDYGSLENKATVEVTNKNGNNEEKATIVELTLNQELGIVERNENEGFKDEGFKEKRNAINGEDDGEQYYLSLISKDYLNGKFNSFQEMLNQMPYYIEEESRKLANEYSDY